MLVDTNESQMTSGGFPEPKYEDYYNRVINSSFELFTDTLINELICNPESNFDTQGDWSRRIFRLYKTFTKLEEKKKLAPFFSKQLFRIVVVLFELKKGSTKAEVKELAATAKNVHASFTNVSNRQSFG